MHKVDLFNSMGNTLTTFIPNIEGRVNMYVCGPTVYSSPHIGNFRPAIVFDTLRRLFIHLGYEVTYASNYTDVDDKIILEAKRLGVSESTLTTNIIEEYRKLSAAMGCLQPDFTPTPTTCMDGIINYIKDLVDNGSAYSVDGDVYFRVRSVKGYGSLSGNSIEALEEGARIEVSSKKEDPLDFALWKRTEEGIKWDSPWGKGRPGWHTECCVMINSIFKGCGGYIDIHGGGFDLKFPHHENEIAQSIAHNGNGLAKYWLHNGFINIDNEKMSKSLGNVLLAKDVVSTYGGIPFRMMVLSSHYRAPASFSDETIKEAGTKFSQLQNSAKKAQITLQLMDIDPETVVSYDESRFLDAICDDLNTPNALSILYEELKDLNNALRQSPNDGTILLERYQKLISHASILGITLAKVSLSSEDKELYQAYSEAKKHKDFLRSDELREILISKGVF